MIREAGHDAISIYWARHVITAVYKGLRLVWQGVRSCFGSGTWIQNKPWLNDEKWKDN